MIYCEAPPSPQLAGFVRCYWSLQYEATADLNEPEVVLPDGCPEIVFNFSDPFIRLGPDRDEVQPTALLAGQMHGRILIRPTGAVNIFGVRFEPGGAFPLVRFPLNEITDKIIDLGSASVSDARQIEEQIRDAGSFEARADIFEAFFRRKLCAVNELDPVECVVSRRILELGGRISISGIASSMGISHRQLERRFKRTIGLTPKELARITRFQSVVRAFQNGEYHTLLDAALTTGYYDQSHLIRDFREFAGVTPLSYFERPHRISDVFTGAA